MKSVEKFKLHSEFKPAGDQPKAIESLISGLKKGMRHQTLLGVTGSGKTFTVANIIEKVEKPTLVIAHNKTLAAQLAQEYRDFFPEQRRALFRFLLRLLSARGLYADYRHLHRKRGDDK